MQVWHPLLWRPIVIDNSTLGRLFLLQGGAGVPQNSSTARREKYQMRPRNRFEVHTRTWLMSAADLPFVHGPIPGSQPPVSWLFGYTVWYADVE